MMTRKDFKTMAAEINAISDIHERKKTADLIAAICKASNPRFDINRFNKACGV